jgi:hypothetical protein
MPCAQGLLFTGAQSFSFVDEERYANAFIFSFDKVLLEDSDTNLLGRPHQLRPMP